MIVKGKYNNNRSIAEIVSEIDQGNLTVTELVKECLQQIKQHQNSLKAIISVNEDALSEAAEIDAHWEKYRKGKRLPGIPLLIKDNIEVKGMVTTAGSLSLRNFKSDEDAFLIERLKKEGAIILAKTNLHEFAIWGETISSVLGQTVNPYDASRTPGGSSGGTGAGVAARMGIAGIGTDTINSVRSPASANCLVGIRPTMGLVSRTGIFPYALSQDVAGPIAGCVADAALLLDVIAGYDKNDPETERCNGQVISGYEKYLDVNGLQNKRIGIMRSFFGEKDIHSEVNRTMEEVIQTLADEGARLEDVPMILDSQAIASYICTHMYEFREDSTAYLCQKGDKVPYHSLDEIYNSGEIGEDVRTQIETALALGRNLDEFVHRMEMRDELREKIREVFEENHYDAILYPHQQQLVCRIGEHQNGRNGSLASAVGFPAITVPAGFSRPTESAPIGVPIGVEFMGLPFKEGKLIEIAYGFEKSNPVRRMPPAMGKEQAN